MSLPEAAGRLAVGRAWRAPRALLAMAALLPLLGGCGFQPLYGTTSSGVGLGSAMASVDIDTIPGRVGQVVRNELIFATTGGDEALGKEYRLEIAMRESITSLLVKSNGDTAGSLYGLDADFKLIRVSDNAVLTSGKASSRAAFQRVKSIYANVRARRDAEDRAARMLATSIRTRVAAVLSKSA